MGAGAAPRRSAAPLAGRAAAARRDRPVPDHVHRWRRLESRPDDDSRDRPHDLLRPGGRRDRPIDHTRPPHLWAVACRAAARLRRALGALDRVVGAAGRELAGGVAPARLQRRVRPCGAARAGSAATLVGGARRGATRERHRLRLRAFDEGLSQPAGHRTGRLLRVYANRTATGTRPVWPPRWGRSHVCGSERAAAGTRC